MIDSSDIEAKTTRCNAVADGTHANSTKYRHRLSDGNEILIRPLSPGDAALEREFLEHLSPDSRAYRFLGEVRVTDGMIAALTKIDPMRDAALIAVVPEKDGTLRAIGVGRFCTEDATRRAECAVVVSDDWQRKGVGALLMNHLIDIARERRLLQLYSTDVAANAGMRALAKRLGFERTTIPDYPSEVLHTLQL